MANPRASIGRTGALLLVLIAACAPVRDQAPAAVTTISIVGTNDFHGALVPAENFGGLPVFSAYLKDLRERRAHDGGAVVLLDAGDMWQGTLESNLSEGTSVVRAFNMIGYDAATIGNHEFDFGPLGLLPTPVSASDDPRGALKARISESNFPMLAVNLIDDASGLPIAWPNVSPSVIREFAGVNVGIIGAITENALRTTIAANTVGLSIAPLLSSIRAEATKLRENGAEIVVVTAHAGGDCKRFDNPEDLSSCRMNSEIFRLAEQLPAGLVDVIVGGHVHQGMAHKVNGTAIISSYSRGQAFGRVDVSVDRNGGGISDKVIFRPQPICAIRNGLLAECAVGRNISGNADYDETGFSADAGIAALIESAVDASRSYKERPTGVTVVSAMPLSSSPESPLGNLLTDIMFAASGGADVAIQNTVGGIRAGLPQGPLTFGSVYEMFPFDNRLIVIPISGAGLREIFANQFRSAFRSIGVSGIRVVARCERQQLQVSLIRNNGREVTDNEQLMLATTDFLATGGGDIFLPVMPPGGFDIDTSAPMLRDEVTRWLENRHGNIDGKDYFDPAERRLHFPEPHSCVQPS